jgi:MFS family permease
MTARADAVVPAASLRRASFAVFAVFFLSGFAFSGWASRLPAVRDALELTPGQMGVLLLALAAGSVVALPLSGVIVQRLGATRTVQVAGSTAVLGLLLAVGAVSIHTVWLTAVGLVAYGTGTAVWDAAMNLEGAAAEQRLGRAVMPRYHAGFSFGTMGGAGIGAGAAALGVPLGAHLPVVLGGVLVAVLVAARSFLPEGTHAARTDDADPADGAGRGGGRAGSFRAWGERRTLLIGLVVLAAALAEGSANDWLSLAVVDGFDATEATGALGFALFVTAMTAMRMLGTALLDRLGRVTTLRLTAALASVGLLVFALAPSLPLAFVGVLAWGAGAALGFPVGMSAAADDPRRAPGRVAVVSTLGYTAFLAGPPLLGLLADHVGYRHALLAVVVPTAISLLLVGVTRPPGEAVRDGADGAGSGVAGSGGDGGAGAAN